MMQEERRSNQFTFADGLSLVLGLLVLLPFAANPNNEVPERLVALGAGLAAMGLAWILTRPRRVMVKVIVVPGVTLGVLILAAIVWHAAV